MQRPTNLKVGDMFRMNGRSRKFKSGEIITLQRDDGSDCPQFWNADKTNSCYINFSKLEPYTKTARDAQEEVK